MSSFLTVVVFFGLEYCSNYGRDTVGYTVREVASIQIVTTANTNTARGQRCDEYRTIFKKTKVRKKERKEERGRLGLYTTG